MIKDLVLRLRGVADASARRLAGTMGDLRKIALGAVAAVSALGSALAALVVGTAHAVDELAKTARSMALTAAQYQALALAADLSGVSVEHLRVGVATLQRQLGAAGRGSKEAVEALRAVGLTAADAARPTAEVFERVLDGLRALPEGAQRNAAAMVLLGESGVRMASLIEGGSAGIRAARVEIEAMGAALTEAQASGAERFVDSMTILRARVSGLSMAIGLRLMPIAQRLLDWLDRVSASAMPRVIDLLDRMAGWVARNADSLVLLGKIIGVTLGGAVLLRAIGAIGTLLSVGAQMVAWAGGLRPLIVALGRALLPMASALLAAVGPALLLGLAIDDLITYAEGGDSAIGRLLETMLGVEGAKELRGLLSDIGGLLSSAASAAVASLPTWQSVVDVFTSISDAVTGAIASLDDWLGTSRMRAQGGASPFVGPVQEEPGILARARASVQSATRGFDRVAAPVNATINVQGVTGEQVAQHIRREIGTLATGTMSQAAR